MTEAFLAALNYIKSLGDLLTERGTFQAGPYTYNYEISPKIGGKPLKGKVKLKWRCILTRSDGAVSIGSGLGKDGSLEKALKKMFKN